MIEPLGKFMNAWNVYLLFLMLFTAFITPYEVCAAWARARSQRRGVLSQRVLRTQVAFLESTPADAFYWVVRSVDISFFVDLLINFNLILYDEETQKYVSKRSEIVTRCVPCLGSACAQRADARDRAQVSANTFRAGPDQHLPVRRSRRRKRPLQPRELPGVR